jgi:thiamine pyrophosphate-dependent acetolactate synthase large subunit-like protein
VKVDVAIVGDAGRTIAALIEAWRQDDTPIATEAQARGGARSASGASRTA